MTLDLEQFNPGIAQLQGLVAEAKNVTVSDLRDKEQLKASKTMRLKLRDARVAITKKGKELREDALKFQKAVISREKELVDIVTPEEERLQKIEDDAAELIERDRRQALLPARREKVDAIKDDIAVSDEQLLGMDDDQFNVHYNTRVANKNRKDQEDIQRRERELKEKEERQERERQQTEERRVKARIDRVTALGLAWNNPAQSYVLEDLNVAMVDIKTMNDEAFDTMMVKIEGEVGRRKQEAAKKAEEKRVQEIRDAQERAKQEERERIEREQRERTEREEQERIEREKNERYQLFLASHGYTEDTKEDFIIKQDTTVKGGEGVRVNRVHLYKRVATFEE